MTCNVFISTNSKTMKNESKSSYKHAGNTVIINNKMGLNLKSVEDRIQNLEQLLSDFGSQLSKSSFDLSSNQQTLVVFNKILSSKPMLKHKRDSSPESNDMNNLERLATIKAVKYWKGIYQMYPHLETSTSSGKTMEGFYKSYFTEFDPYQVWFTPNQFFNTVVVKKQKNLLGLATITLVLRIAIISVNNPSMQVKNLYKHFEQLTQLHLPESYGTPSFDNVLAYLFMGINCMSYSDHIGFSKYYTLAAKMTMLLDMQNAKDKYTLLPENDPNLDRYAKEIIIWKSVYYLDSFFSVIRGMPPQFTKNTVWNEEVNTENMLKFLKITPFSTIPTNPPRNIYSFYALTPGLDEIETLAFYIVNRVKSLQEKYKHLAHPKLIPVQDIFFEYSDYTKLNRSSKIIQNTLVNLYTTDKMKEYLETPEEQSSASALLKEITHTLDLMIIYHYPHIKFYIQPAIMPASYIPKVSKIIDQLLAIYTDYFDLSPSHNKFQAYPPFRFDSIWNCLFTCLNISLQVPSNRINTLINKLISLITIHYIHYECNYSIIDLDKYLERYGHSLEQYSSNENTP